MKTDGVLAAFDIILEELEEVANEIKEEARISLDTKKFLDMGESIETWKRLDAFSAKVEILREEWTSSFDENTRQRTHLEVEHGSAQLALSQTPPQPQPETFATLTIKDAVARAKVEGARRLVLLPESTVCKTEQSSLSPALRERRQTSIAEGALTEIPGKDLYKVESPIGFRSPSEAAKFVSASSISGPASWIVEGGIGVGNISLGAWKRLKGNASS